MRLLAALVVIALGPALVQEAGAQDVDTTNVDRGGQAWVVHAGVGSVHGWNFAGVTREFTGGRFRPFLTAGLGTILVGVGATYYTNPQGSGLVLAATAGVAGAHGTAAVAVRVRQRLHLLLGGSYGSYYLQHVGLLPVAALSIRP